MNSKSKLAIAVVLLGAVALAAFYYTRDEQKAESFDIGMVTFAGYAPLYLAKEKGFFGDLDVELHRIDEVASIRAGISNGELEAYLATPDIALDTNNRPLGKAVWAIDESAGGDGVVVSGDIADLKDLRGKAVGHEPGLPPSFILLYLLHQNGISASEVSFKDLSTQDANSAFVSKAVDAAALYEPFLSSAAKNREGSKVVISSADTPGMIVDLIFVRDDQLAENKRSVEKVITGWRKAIAFIKSNPDEANSIMAKSFDLPADEFKDIVSGIKWLDLEENKYLFGDASADGPLYESFDVVRDVLKRHRKDVFDAKRDDHLTREMISEQE